MKRSNAPIFWLLFGGGGMLAALFGTMLVFITGVAVPLGWPLPTEVLSYPHALGFARNLIGKVFLLAVIALFAWHAAHRLLCSVHDLGIHKTVAVKSVFYGSAALITAIAAFSLVAIGF
jgi:fumarate reductase subunit D